MLVVEENLYDSKKLVCSNKKSVYTDAVINSVNVGFGSEERSFIGN